MLAQKRTVILVVSIAFLFSQPICDVRAAGQMGKEPPKVFTLEQAASYAIAHRPAIRAAQEHVTAARGGVDLARTATSQGLMRFGSRIVPLPITFLACYFRNR